MGAARRSTRRSFSKQEACPVAACASATSGEAIVAASEIHFSDAEVYAAVESLYDDRLRPYGRIIRKRLVEIARAAGFDAVEEADGKQLRDFCESCSGFHMEYEANGEWSALLVNRSQDFVDVYDGDDNYPESLWIAAEEYFHSLKQKADETDISLPGGRYSSARALQNRSLPFLEGFSLGEICHITQLAISKRRLLGYREGAVVPYDMSTSMVKRRCAEQQRPISKTSAGDNNLEIIADWDQARECLRKILDSAQVVPLSNIKRICRSTYKLDFSETALGYAKLSDLLHDQRLHDICEVRLQERGYVVLPAPKYSEQSTDQEVCHEEDVNDEHLAREQPRDVATRQQDRMKFCVNEPLEIDGATCLDDRPVANSPFPVTPSPVQHPLDAAATASFLQLIMPRMSDRDIVSCSRMKFCPEEPLELEEPEEPLASLAATPAIAFPICTPSPCSRHACANSLLGQRGIPLQIAAYI